MKTHRLPNELEVYYLNAGETRWIYDEVFVRDSYFQHGISLSPGACVVDAGSNIGLFALHAASRARGGRLYCFEPSPAVFEVLRANIELHQVGARLFNCALSDREGTATFTFYPHNSVMSGLYADSDEDKRTTRISVTNQRGSDAALRMGPLLDGLFKATTTECRLRRLSNVIREEGIECIDLLKVDVEKSEADLLAGIDDADWPKIRQLVVEVHDSDGRLAELRARLAAFGFTLVVEQDPTLKGTNLYTLYAFRPTP